MLKSKRHRKITASTVPQGPGIFFGKESDVTRLLTHLSLSLSYRYSGAVHLAFFFYVCSSLYATIFIDGPHILTVGERIDLAT